TAGGYGAPSAYAPGVDAEEAAPPAPAGVPPSTPYATSAATAPHAGASTAPVAIVPSSPSVKAGEWDDNANWRELNKWMATEERQPFHRADVSTRRFLVVRDRD